MDNSKKPSSALAVVIIGLLLVNTFIQWIKYDSLENRIDNLQSSIFGLSFNNDYGAMESRILEEIKSSSSLIEASETKLGFRNGKMMLTVSLVPKLVNEGDTFYVVSGYEKVEARKIDEVSYVANLAVKPDDIVQMYAVIETEEGDVQEALPEIYLDQYFAIDLSSIGISEDRTLSIEIAARSEETSPFLESLEEAKVIIYDQIGKKIMEIPFVEVESNNSLSEEDYGYKFKAFELKLPEELFEMEYFSAKAVIENYGIKLGSDEIYTYSKDGRATQGVSGGQFYLSYDQ
ncbi:MAG TPA: hypothetical protein VLM88_03525 [Proteiniclasticum sp.]|nr:hypothetical protein [Proteiniclasticum sp.]